MVSPDDIVPATVVEVGMNTLVPATPPQTCLVHDSDRLVSKVTKSDALHNPLCITYRGGRRAVTSHRIVDLYV
jgi:hypothetical protein